MHRSLKALILLPLLAVSQPLAADTIVKQESGVQLLKSTERKVYRVYNGEGYNAVAIVSWGHPGQTLRTVKRFELAPFKSVEFPAQGFMIELMLTVERLDRAQSPGLKPLEGYQKGGSKK